MSDELPLKATLKAGGGYEAPWITVDGANADDLYTRLGEISEEVIQKVVDVAALLRAAHTVVGGFDAPAAQAAVSATVTQSAPVASGDLKTCAHGVRTKRQGNSARGPWTGYFCPLKKGDPNQCKAIFED